MALLNLKKTDFFKEYMIARKHSPVFFFTEDNISA